MGWVSLFGCLTTAYGPALVLFLMLVTPKAQLFMVFILSSFCWILAMLAASIAWTALEPLIASAGFWLLVLAACQECARYAFFRAYARAENNFSMAATNGVLYPLSDFTSSLAGGLAFGVTQTVMLYGSTLGAALGPGTVFPSTCPQLSTFSLAACVSMFFVFHHLTWMVVAFDGYRRKSLWRVVFVAASNVLASILVALESTPFGCTASLPLQFALLIVNAAVAWHCIHRPAYRSKLRSL